LPLWAALAIPGAAYVLRSVVLRGGDFTPDVPQDLIAAAVLAVGVATAAAIRARYARAPQSPDAFGPDTEETAGTLEG
jgi:hypothetical protein